MRVVPFGDAAVRCELPPGADRRAVLDALRALPRVVDALVTDRHALVRYTPGPPPEGLERAVLDARPGEGPTPRLHLVRTRYDGPDLACVAALTGLTGDELVALHAGVAYEVQLVGFLPGFAYLGPLAPPLAGVPRRASPRPRVAPLAVGIAAGRTGIYPFASPGGWQLIGTALDVAPFDAARGALFQLGDRVRFEPA